MLDIKLKLGRKGGGNGDAKPLPTNIFTGGGLIFKDHKAREWIAELQAEMLKHARELAALKLEWSDTYDRILKLTQRMAKRAEIAEKLSAGAQGREPGLNEASEILAPRTASDDGGGTPPSSLTVRQQQLNDKILARRSRKPEVTQ